MKLQIQDFQRAILGYLIYLGTAGMGLELALWEDLAPLIWPPMGYGLGFLLLRGVRFWPVLFFGAFTVSYFENAHLLESFSIAMGYTLAGSATAYVLKEKFDFRIEMERINDVFVFVLFAVILAPILSAGVYTFIENSTQAISGVNLFTFFSVRWLSDALGTLSLTPFLVVWFSKTRINWRDHQAIEVLLWLGLLIFLGAMVFRNWAPTDTLRYPLELAMFPLTAWAAIRFGQRGVTLAVLIVSLMAVWELRDVISPGATRTITQPPGYLWVFVGVLSITSLFLAAVLSELRSREERTRTNEERLAGFIRALPDLAFVFSPQGVFVEVFAPKTNVLAGITEKWKGQHLSSIYPPGLAMAFEDAIEKVIRTDEVEVVRYAMAIDGVDSWFEGRFAPVESENGSSGGVISFAYDITLNQRAQQELHYRDRLLRTLTDAESELLKQKGYRFQSGLSSALALVGKGSALDWIEVFTFHKDLEGSLHQSFQSEYQWLRDVSYAENIFELEPSLLSSVQKDWLTTLQSNQPITCGSGFKLDDPKSNMRSELIGIRSLFMYPLFANGSLYGFVLYASTVDELLEDTNLTMILKSISESLGAFIGAKIIELELLKAKESAESADLAKGEFLAMMSHEIRTPMNAIVGFADLLKKTEMSADQEEFIGIINRSGKELLDLINNILDFSKLESNRIELEETSFYIETTIVESLEMVLMKARAKGIGLDYEIIDESSGVYIGDPLRLRQVLVNLLSNAVKFTKEGGVRLTIETHAVDIEHRRDIVISVEDTGIGIPALKIKDLFKPFEQLDSSTTREFGGTGLGLTIVDRIVSKMGGTIEVQSEVDKGTRMTVKIQLDCEPMGENYPQKSSESDSTIKLAELLPLNILIVESVESSARLISEILSRLGYESKLVDSAEVALNALKKGSYDVIFIDVNLAQENSESITQSIREGTGGKQHAKMTIIALTAHSLAEEKAKILASGVDYYLMKPIQLDDVRLALLQARGE